MSDLVIRKFSKVLVLMGGRSPERDVSILSGRNCSKMIRAVGYDVLEVDASDPDLMDKILKYKPDVCFNALHGLEGEDGGVQGMLNFIDLPYTHSGVRSSACAFDKYITRLVYSDVGIPISPGKLASLDCLLSELMEPPFVIKPRCSGSSYGVHLIKELNDKDLKGKKISDLLPLNEYKEFYERSDFNKPLLVEKYIPGRELSVGVFKGEAMLVTEIVFKGDIFDCQAKYSEGVAKHIVPANIPEDIRDKCLDFATKAHLSLDCRGVSRTDFRFCDPSCDYPILGGKSSDLPVIIALETNTQPGMTELSLIPEQIENHHKFTLEEFIVEMIEGASCVR